MTQMMYYCLNGGMPCEYANSGGSCQMSTCCKYTVAEREQILNNGIDMAFRGGAIMFAEKIKSKMYETSDPREGEPCAEFSANDIDEMLRVELQKEKINPDIDRNAVIDANLGIVRWQITAVARRGKTTTYIYGYGWKYWTETCQKLVELGYKVEPDEYGAQVSWGGEYDK